jgi:Trk K+ transport system NAD-binding subunit
MAAALKEVKEKNMLLATAAKTFVVPRTTLRARLDSGR